MAISGISNLSYGTTYQPGKPDQIISDGKVEKRFQSEGPDFISDVTDSRVQQFCSKGSAPSDNWKPHPMGGFDSENQSLFIENERVVLRSNGEDSLRHIVNAPFDSETGQIDLESSTEGFDTAPSDKGGKTSTFTLPAGSNIEFGGVFDLDDPNALGNILS